MALRAGAINPYLAFETLDDMVRQGDLPKVDDHKAVKNYIKAVGKAWPKVMSKHRAFPRPQSYCSAHRFSRPSA